MLDQVHIAPWAVVSLQRGFRLNLALAEQSAKLIDEVLIRIGIDLVEMNTKTVAEPVQQRMGLRRGLVPDDIPVLFGKQTRRRRADNRFMFHRRYPG